jgi:hypothetical protein
LGNSIFNRLDSNFIVNILINFLRKQNLFKNINFLQRNLGRISISEFYLINNNIIKIKKPKFILLLGIDNIKFYNKLNINIYQGSFYLSSIFKLINIILPTNIFLEQIVNYINLEGRIRISNKIISIYKYLKILI